MDKAQAHPIPASRSKRISLCFYIQTTTLWGGQGKDEYPQIVGNQSTERLGGLMVSWLVGGRTQDLNSQSGALICCTPKVTIISMDYLALFVI